MSKTLRKQNGSDRGTKEHVMSFRISKTECEALRLRGALFGTSAKTSGNQIARMILLGFLEGSLIPARRSGGCRDRFIAGPARGLRASDDTTTHARPRKFMRPRLVKEALTHYADKEMTTDEIARKFRISTATLTYWAKKSGFPVRGRGRRRNEQPTLRQQQMILEAQNGTYESVAKKYGLTKAYIGSLMTRWHGRRPKRGGGAATACPPYDVTTG